ncbi:hypothetical protein EW093_14440 [Thiospirochaeta perfilievii]|uniref:Uncharacterized protein n=1 Tax=Thiospirochaeta perfilievii TaxID=252967 RepID=A0A5C1QEN6_9SPIO|nr:hypothetical protein [Thiospirochaeta perfilievii]QEN05848.1 hypothetical protein EW093_14440 [Thiospirochaeta perfilievii]
MRNSLLIICLTLLSLPLFSLDKKPNWVNFQEAKMFYESGNFREALDYYLQVTKSPTPNPEAEYMIGLLYLEEGELEIAEEQILKAISLSHYLQVKEDLMFYKYSLAKVYLLKDDYDSYVSTLKDIIGKSSIDLQEVRDQRAYYDTILESGVNRLLHLYRKDADNVLNARIYLGYYYNSIGKYLESVNYLLSPMLSLVTEVINDNIKQDREYVFISMEQFFKEVGKNKRVQEYFEENDFYKLFYYLGESFYGLGLKEQANEFWELLVNSNLESKWINKAKKQLKDPSLEEWKFVY